jgi:acyl-CoA synthetase (AMP-forming)/AMP-acid ligase II
LSFDEAVADQPDELEPPADTHADDMAFWLYSSGSTGRPKGVVHTHADIGITIDTYARHVLRISDADVCYSTTKLFHAYGLGNGLSFPLSAGATAIQVRGPSRPDRILETVARYRPTLFFSVPALYAAMLKSPQAPQTDFSSVRACVSAAEALPAAIQERWQQLAGVPILDGIGSTEMLHIYCSNTLGDLRPGTSGRPVPGYELRVVDDEGRDVPPGDPGNLLVRGDSCAAYYWHQRSKTRQCMRGDWFFTGDRYVKTPDGYFVYQGRADDMIKAGGLWVSPADMEACLVSHPAVSEAAVIGVHVDEVSRVKAFVICAKPPADQQALADELRQRYPAVHWRPEQFVTEDGRLFCSGGVYAAADLSLYLVEKFCGREVALQCSKAMLLSMPRHSQTGYALLPLSPPHADDKVREAEAYLQKRFRSAVSIDQLGRAVNMSPRNLMRRFKAATGRVPGDYVQTLRVAAARELLERGGRISVQEVCTRVGYEDAEFFRQLFKRHTGLSPAEYRSRFAGMSVERDGPEPGG